MSVTIKERLSYLDSAALSDALDSLKIEGCLLGIKPLLPGKKISGKVFTVKYVSYDEEVTEFKNAGNYIDDVPSGSVILIDNGGRCDCTVWGDILTNVALLKGVVGTVIYGAVRDVEAIKHLDYPVFSTASYMRSGKNRVKKIAQQVEVQIGLVKVNAGDYIFADDNGALAIPNAVCEEVIARAENISKNEQYIISAVKSGCSLKKAREKFRYDQPWLGEKV